MIEYENDILGIEVKWLAGDRENAGEIMTYERFHKMRRSGKLRQLRKGGRGRTALVDYESMPEWLKQAIAAKLGYSPYEVEQYHYFRKYLQEDDEAFHYFRNYLRPNGKKFTTQKVKELTANAKMLNALVNYHDAVKSRRRAMGGRRIKVWESLSKLTNHFRDELGHTLPKHPKSLQIKMRNYRNNEYAELLPKKDGNTNALKRNSNIDELIMSLYVAEGKPYMEEVWKMYNRFINGDMELYVKKGERAGEIIDPEEFYQDGEPVMLSLATVNNILNQYRDVVDKKRNDWLYYNNLHRPHHHRKAPQFSLSKLSLDDRDLPPLLTNGGHVKAYFIWDIGSEAILGVAFSTRKDTQLFVGAMQDAFRNAYAWGLNMPMEVEVEHHLVEQFKPQLEVMFPFVRWASGGNAQEKRAEHKNRAFKYQYEKHEFPTGRFYAKLEAHRPNQRKEWDDEGMHTVQQRYSYKEVVDLYEKIIHKYNHDPHSKLDKPRIEVLKENQNPDAKPLSLPVIAQSFGEEAKTSLRRNQYVRVQYQNYQLPSPEIARRINKNKDVFAYYLPDEKGVVDQVHLYQDGRFICSCNKIERYNEAKAEWTDKDTEYYQEQASYVSQYDKQVKETTGKLINLGTLEPAPVPEAPEIKKEDKELEYVPKEQSFEIEKVNIDDYKNKARDC